MVLSVVWLLVLAVIVGLFVARGLKAILVAGAVSHLHHNHAK
jgi:hypothetical protein